MQGRFAGGRHHAPPFAVWRQHAQPRRRNHHHGIPATGIHDPALQFPGVEGSQGRYDEGRGEQEDVRQAVAYLQQHGYGPIGTVRLLVWDLGQCPLCGRQPVGDPHDHGVPPRAFMDFRKIQHLPGLTLAITGSRDDIAPPDMLRRMLPLWNPGARLEVLPGADHFFIDQLETLAAALNKALAHHHTSTTEE